jgi:hypothetical protein
VCGWEREQGKEGGRELGKGGSPSHPLAWLGQEATESESGRAARGKLASESREQRGRGGREQQRGQRHCPAGPLAWSGPARPGEARATL